MAKLREQLVLGQLRPLLHNGEHVSVWAHVRAPDGGPHGIVALTSGACLVHWTAPDHPDAELAWADMTGWTLEAGEHDGPVLILEAVQGKLAVELSVSSKASARKASRVVHTIAAYVPGEGPPESFTRGPDLLRARRRGVRGHTRRVAVTILGWMLILLGLVFASPFVPGPGTLTVLAGLAILASEYDWARDAHQWLKRTVERLLARRRSRRARG